LRHAARALDRRLTGGLEFCYSRNDRLSVRWYARDGAFRPFGCAYTCVRAL
jgi:hypothetical protein